MDERGPDEGALGHASKYTHRTGCPTVSHMFWIFVFPPTSRVCFSPPDLREAGARGATAMDESQEGKKHTDTMNRRSPGKYGK
eukprot:9482099-Pyramimonas_sp.AAC.1